MRGGGDLMMGAANFGRGTEGEGHRGSAGGKKEKSTHPSNQK